jgi:glycine dehydrogenase subunit 1
MTYIPHTDAERAEMLARIGVHKIDDLFKSVPEAHRFPQIDLPEPLSELEILEELRVMAEENDDLQHYPSFLGAGAYHHFVPSVVNHIIGRSEFYTAYTPYQPEVSQGTLQSIFEYQTMICDLTGMPVSNASHYDGATALAEGVLMAKLSATMPRATGERCWSWWTTRPPAWWCRIPISWGESSTLTGWRSRCTLVARS